MTIKELWTLFYKHAVIYYRDKDTGRQTKEAQNIEYAFRTVLLLYGDDQVDAFGPRKIKIVREAMITKGISRRVINTNVNKIRAVFSWAIEDEIISPHVLTGLKQVKAIAEGRSLAKENPEIQSVPWTDVSATLQRGKLSDTLQAMVRLHWHTGMRAGELVIMRPMDIDRSDPDLWVYRPIRHKNKWRGKPREIRIGPQGQAVLKRFLLRGPAAFCFTHHRKNAPAAGAYTTNSYGNAVRKACLRAGVMPWCLLQVRHAAATRIERAIGEDAARAVLGHSSAKTTKRYIDPKDVAIASEVMRKMG